MGIENFIKTVCVQTAVYWGNPVNDGSGGKTYDAAIEIPVRWEEVGESIVLNNGEQCTSKAEIMLTQDVTVEGYIYLGSLDDLTLAQRGNPKLVEGAFKIVKFSKVPMIKSTSDFIRKCYL